MTRWSDPRVRVSVALAGLVLLGALVRFWGLWYGLPHPLARPDEELVVGHSMALSLGGIDDEDAFPYPHLVYLVDPVRGRPIRSMAAFAYPYPDLVYIMNAGVLGAWRKIAVWSGTFGSTDEFIEHLALRRPDLPYKFCRAVGALAGVATVLAAFAAAFWAYRRHSVALIAALLIAVNFLHARDSHYATVDVPMTLMLTLALAFALKAAESQTRRDVLISAAFAGLAASAKFNGAVIVASTVVAAARRFFDPSSARGRWRILWTLTLAAAVMIGVFAITSPWCIQFAKTVHLGLRTQRRVLFGTEGAAAGLTFVSWTLPGAFGWPAYVAAIAGLARALWKRRIQDLVILAYFIPAFASMALITWVLPRYPIPLLPALALFAAEATGALLPRLRPAWIAVLLLALAGPPLVRIIEYDRLASRPDTRLLAEDWLRANIEPKARIAVCRGYGAPRVNADDRTPPAFDRREVIPCDVTALKKTEPRYVITHAHPAIAYFAPSNAARQWLETSARPVATFSPFRAGRETTACFYPGDAFYLPYCGFGALERGGPVITIWELNDALAAVR